MLARVIRPLRRTGRLALDWARGGVERHRATAELRGYAQRAKWPLELRRLRRSGHYRPTILIGLVDHLGDIVAAEPIAHRLRLDHPDAYIAWAVRPAFRELIDSNPHIDAALPMSCFTEWLVASQSLGFDRIVDLHVPGRFCDRCCIASQPPPDGPGISLDNYYHHGNLLDIFCRVGRLPHLSEAPRVYISPEVRQQVDDLELPEAYVAVHARSNQLQRDWDPDKWLAAVEAWIGSGVAVVEVGLEAAVAPLVDGCIDLCGRLSLLETAEVLRRASVFVGVDSGPAHLANAVGTPGVIVLGRYFDFEGHTPYSGSYADGSNADLLRADGPAAALPTERVLEAVSRRLPRPVAIPSTSPAVTPPG